MLARQARALARSSLRFAAVRSTTQRLSSRTFSTAPRTAMAEPLKQSEVNSQTDPSVAKQFDRETPISDQIAEFYKLVDGERICMVGTQRAEGGSGVQNTVTRAMAVAKREGPDFHFLCNRHSQKVTDLTSTSDRVNITFLSGSSWASVSGKATCSPEDPKIKEVYSPVVSAWFGDLGDGVHSGGADDPRMCLLTVRPDRIVYYVNTKGKVARMADMATAVATGRVAQTGVLREIVGDAIEGARSSKSSY